MFTGIVQGTAKIIAIHEKKGFRSHRIQLPVTALEGLQPGASIAHNGCCLTVTHIENDVVDFDLMQETLNVTNLGELTVGDAVNFERAARFGDEIGGHAMSGHILCTAEVTDVIISENNRRIRFSLPGKWQKYLFTKGYIGIDGISLTIGHVENHEFDINLIPETLQRTNIGTRKIGDRVNIEIDPQTQAIVDTVNNLLPDMLIKLMPRGVFSIT
ncbi:MAG: riboflavin synthase subunit alpha [Candidatus Thiodiazotropha sp. (ex Epidulcina cf. delphinae)]|nr:riboflavin synthase subunit alpha [Candidatus Thiodiazotropha sp. (ex Epidulcina cf. delphinae)]